MGIYLVAFIESPPVALQRDAVSLEERWCFAEVYPGEHSDRLLGELVHDPALAAPAAGLSRKVAERRGTQAPELLGSEVVALDAEALERLATGTWIKHSKGFPQSLGAVLGAVRALGEGARLTYWFEGD